MDKEKRNKIAAVLAEMDQASEKTGDELAEMLSQSDYAKLHPHLREELEKRLVTSGLSAEQSMYIANLTALGTMEYLKRSTAKLLVDDIVASDEE